MSTFLEENMSGLSVTDVDGVEGIAVAKGKEVAVRGAEVVSDSEIDENTCAICLNKMCLSDTAQPDTCDHVYCACCILHWSVYKEKAWCPQCKTPFSSLLTFRSLDGQLRDYPTKESICLLKRAGWFQEHVKMREQAIAEATAPRPSSAGFGRLEGSVIDETDYVDYARYYDEYDDDEEVENYYFSAAAGRARVVLGNRRHGPNGYLSSGRLQARPAAPPPQPKDCAAKGSGEKKPGSEAGSARKQQATTPAARQNGSQRAARRGSTSSRADEESSPGGSSGKESAGRRARRNQRRAAADARAGL